MFYLGLMHRYGVGVAKDASEAARWYRKAAELGDVTSMRSLAELYEEGDGVAKDPAEALRWRRAAKEPASPSGAAPLDAKAVLLRRFDPDRYEPVELAFSRDGARILSLASGGYFRWLDVDGRSEAAEFGSLSCCQLVLSPSGKLAATGSYDEKAVMLWDLTKGELAAALKAHSDHVIGVSFSPNGKHLASASYDGTVILWDAAGRKLIRKFEAEAGKVQSVAFSPDGKVLASGHDEGDIKLWDVASGRLLQSLKADGYSVYSLIFTPDGGLLAARNGFAINLWDVAKGSMVRSLQGVASAISLSSMAMSPDGTEIVSGDHDGSIRVWDVAEGKQLQEIEAHPKEVSAVAYSPDGKLLASAGGDNTVKLWNLGSVKAAGR
jgi:WD40 repeat protein